MVFGIGNDIVEIKRIARAIENEHFKKRVFTEKEIEILEKKGINKISSYAGRFAAKEAISKALGTGVRDFKIVDIEILSTDLGKPVVFFHGSLKDKMDGKKIEISISHSKEYATAVAIIFNS